ncbi:MAG: ATP synthase F1 subunit epsilon [Candidatus Cloacimonas sp.]|nr:ATP synthase F1 subunit epsilon [Candidatus Cloacimonadota bacterium]
MSLHLKIIQPYRTVAELECDHVIIPGIDGDIGVSTGHTPLLTKIRPGPLVVFQKDTKINYAIHDGFVSIEKDKIRIVCEIIECGDEIDQKRAEEAKKRAEERLKDTESDIDFRRAESSLRRAVARLQSIAD